MHCTQSVKWYLKSKAEVTASKTKHLYSPEDHSKTQKIQDKIQNSRNKKY